MGIIDPLERRNAVWVSPTDDHSYAGYPEHTDMSAFSEDRQVTIYTWNQEPSLINGSARNFQLKDNERLASLIDFVIVTSTASTSIRIKQILKYISEEGRDDISKSKSIRRTQGFDILVFMLIFMSRRPNYRISFLYSCMLASLLLSVSHCISDRLKL